MAKSMLPELAKLGYRLLLTTRAVDSLREHCEREGIEAKCFGADLTSDEEVKALFAWVEEHGGCDVLINNAGIAHAAASWKLEATRAGRSGATPSTSWGGSTASCDF